MVQKDHSPDDMPTGPLPVLGTDGLPVDPAAGPAPEPAPETASEPAPEAGVMPVPAADPEAPSIARERLEPHDEPEPEPEPEPESVPEAASEVDPGSVPGSRPRRPVSEISAETLRRQDLMTAAVVGVFAVLMLGVVVAMLWA